MVKTLHTLALRAMSVNREMTPILTRIQHGFMPGKQLEQAQEAVRQLQEMLCDMQKALDAPPSTFTPAKNYIPMK